MAEIAINRYVDSLYEIAKEDHIEQELLYQLNQVRSDILFFSRAK